MDQAMAFPRYNSYKDSGTDWLGEMPSDWSLESIRAVTQLKSEKNQPDLQVLSVYREYGVIPKDSRDDNHNATSLDTSGYKVVSEGDLVVNKMKAWQGSMGVSEHNGIVSPAYITCRVDAERVHPKFLHYLLRSQPYIGVYNALSYGVRVGQWDMHYEDFKRIPLPLPERTCQQRIANFLDKKTAEIDEAIAKKQRLIELLKEQKAILINQAVTKGLNPNVPMRHSGVEWIGEVPAHWSFPQFGYCCNVIKDGLHHTPPKHQEGVNFVSTQHVRNRQINIDDATFISTKAYKEGHPRIRPQAGDVLITLVGSIGFAALVEEIHMPLSFTRHVGYVRCIEQKLNPQYLINYTESYIFKCFIEKNVSQTAQPSIYLSSLAAHKLPLPPIDEQQKIVDWISDNTIPYDQATANAEREIHLFGELRQVIVNDAVTGKIKL